MVRRATPLRRAFDATCLAATKSAAALSDFGVTVAQAGAAMETMRDAIREVNRRHPELDAQLQARLGQLQRGRWAEAGDTLRQIGRAGVLLFAIAFLLLTLAAFLVTAGII